MTKKRTEETQPIPGTGDESVEYPQKPDFSQAPEATQPVDSPAEPRKKRRIGRWILLGILIVVVATALSSFLAYSSGISARKTSENQVRLAKAAEHFNYGIQMMDQKKYDLAMVQFSYVAQLDPGFPGLMEKMTESQMKAIESQIPTAAPTPMTTSTPDTRGVDELFTNAQESIRNGDWQQAFQELESLRNADLTYRAVEVDGMYYIVLRNMGVQQIFGSTDKGVSGGKLEEGIYSLYLASKFAPIDKDAVTAREWARRYIDAASYWGVNWQNVIDQFQIIYQSYPYMTDFNGKTAFARYAMALAYLGIQLDEKGDPCAAVQKLQDANAVFQQFNRIPPDDIGNLMDRINDASNRCSGPAPTKKPDAQVTVESTPEPTVEQPPTETPTPTETTTP